jgi:hypothetical protein
MSQPVGILTVQIWRSEQGELQARVSSKLDAMDSSPLDPIPCTSLDEITAEVAAWFHGYAALVPPTGHGS